MTAAAIELRALRKHFGETEVLHGIDLTVLRGEFVGLVGPNGAGKSTMLRILVGLYRLTSGRAAVLGLDPQADPIGVRQRCSYLPGETSVYMQMTGADFLAFAQSFQQRRDHATERRLADLFALPLKQKIRAYSSGMKQKLAVLAALSADSELYLLDEPDRALDATMRMELRHVLQQLHAGGRTIVLSSHHLEEVHALATRLAFLRRGTLVPDPEVDAARHHLARRFRVRLDGDAPLPPGATLLERAPDGTLHLESEGPPAEWLRGLPTEAVRSVEVGVLRLEDLYQQLFLAARTAEGAAG